MTTISERIRKIRTESTGKRISQDEFATSINVSRSMVANMEDAENRLANGIPERTLARICEVYHINYQWLSTGEGEMMQDISQDTDALIEKYMGSSSLFEKSIMKAFAELPDEEWLRLRDIIDQIKKERGQ